MDYYKKDTAEAKVCYARGKIQYFFTFLFGMIFILEMTLPLWGKIEIEEGDVWLFLIINILLGLFFIYFVLLCLFFKVSVSENKIIYTNIFNRTVKIDASEIKKIDPIAGRGLQLRMRGRRITMYVFYQNYKEVRDEILKALAKTQESNQ